MIAQRRQRKGGHGRPGLVACVEKFIGCHDFANGYLYYERPKCGDFYMVGFSCHSRICPRHITRTRDTQPSASTPRA